MSKIVLLWGFLLPNLNLSMEEYKTGEKTKEFSQQQNISMIHLLENPLSEPMDKIIEENLGKYFLNEDFISSNKKQIFESYILNNNISKDNFCLKKIFIKSFDYIINNISSQINQIIKSYIIYLANNFQLKKDKDNTLEKILTTIEDKVQTFSKKINEKPYQQLFTKTSALQNITDILNILDNEDFTPIKYKNLRDISFVLLSSNDSSYLKKENKAIYRNYAIKDISILLTFIKSPIKIYYEINNEINNSKTFLEFLCHEIFDSILATDKYLEEEFKQLDNEIQILKNKENQKKTKGSQWDKNNEIMKNFYQLFETQTNRNYQYQHLIGVKKKTMEITKTLEKIYEIFDCIFLSNKSIDGEISILSDAIKFLENNAKKALVIKDTVNEEKREEIKKKIKEGIKIIKNFYEVCQENNQTTDHSKSLITTLTQKKEEDSIKKKDHQKIKDKIKKTLEEIKDILSKYFEKTKNINEIKDQCYKELKKDILQTNEEKYSNRRYHLKKQFNKNVEEILQKLKFIKNLFSEFFIKNQQKDISNEIINYISSHFNMEIQAGFLVMYYVCLDFKEELETSMLNWIKISIPEIFLLKNNNFVTEKMNLVEKDLMNFLLPEIKKPFYYIGSFSELDKQTISKTIRNLLFIDNQHMENIRKFITIHLENLKDDEIRDVEHIIKIKKTQLRINDLDNIDDLSEFYDIITKSPDLRIELENIFNKNNQTNQEIEIRLPSEKLQQEIKTLNELIISTNKTILKLKNHNASYEISKKDYEIFLTFFDFFIKEKKDLPSIVFQYIEHRIDQSLKENNQSMDLFSLENIDIMKIHYWEVLEKDKNFKKAMKNLENLIKKESIEIGYSFEKPEYKFKNKIKQDIEILIKEDLSSIVFPLIKKNQELGDELCDFSETLEEQNLKTLEKSYKIFFFTFYKKNCEVPRGSNYDHSTLTIKVNNIKENLSQLALDPLEEFEEFFVNQFKQADQQIYKMIDHIKKEKYPHSEVIIKLQKMKEDVNEINIRQDINIYEDLNNAENLLNLTRAQELLSSFNELISPLYEKKYKISINENFGINNDIDLTKRIQDNLNISIDNCLKDLITLKNDHDENNVDYVLESSNFGEQRKELDENFTLKKIIELKERELKEKKKILDDLEKDQEKYTSNLQNMLLSIVKENFWKKYFYHFF